jgi:hypothetical protein
MRRIKLTQGYVALVDDKDYQRVSQFNWSAMRTRKTVYAQHAVKIAKNKWKIELMHRFILGITDSAIQVDHEDRNGLHNWRKNLRIATHSQNMMNRGRQSNNTSGETGVRWTQNRWRAEIKVNGKVKHLGQFISKAQAIRARREAAIKIHGEFRSSK